MIEFTLPTMTCGHCVKTVTQVVQSIDAQAKVEIDLGQHRLRIDSAQTPGRFLQALGDAGYPPAGSASTLGA
jgi:copper chaperone